MIQAATTTEQLLLGKLDRFVDLVKSRDMALLDELWGDGDFLMVGSGKAEICRTREELRTKLRSVFATPAILTFDWPERTVTVVGNAAWIFATGDVVIRSPTGDIRSPYLVTCIFEKVGTDWRWRQFFGSEPA